MKDVAYFEVAWYGPFDDAKHADLADANLVLYMITGTHGLYGKNVPLYIGKTLQSVPTRIGQHEWIEWEPDPVKIYAAAISPPFTSWSEVAHMNSYPPLADAVISEVESLLIYAHQPVYNSRSKGGQQAVPRELHLFNTGRRSSLYPEVSSFYWYR